MPGSKATHQRSTPYFIPILPLSLVPSLVSSSVSPLPNPCHRSRVVHTTSSRRSIDRKLLRSPFSVPAGTEHGLRRHAKVPDSYSVQAAGTPPGSHSQLSRTSSKPRDSETTATSSEGLNRTSQRRPRDDDGQAGACDRVDSWTWS